MTEFRFEEPSPHGLVYVPKGHMALLRHQDIRFQGKPLIDLSRDELQQALAQALDFSKTCGVNLVLG